MAPSEIHFAGETSRNLSSSGLKKDEQSTGTGSAINEETGSNEEFYWEHHRHPNDKDDNHFHGETHNGDHESRQIVRLQRRPTRSRNLSNNNNSSSISSIRTIPKVKYAKAGIIYSPANVVIDRGGVGGAEEAAQVHPGETLYLATGTNSKAAAGQYQLHPSFNNDVNNGNSINYNNLNGGPPQTQPHPYNTHVGMGGVPHYPMVSYPHPAAGGYPNYYDPNGQFVVTSNTTSNGLNVRGEEVGIVLVVLLLWVGAIILFFNRWGKIRMLEPYQPKFCETNHRSSCPLAEVTAITTTHPVCRERTFSKFNLSTEMLAGPNGSPHFVKCNYHGIPSADPAPGFSGFTTAAIVPGGLTIPGAGFPGGGSTGMLSNHRNSIMMNHHHHHQHSRPRQNSVFVTSPSSQVSFYGSDTTLKNSSRKTKSAVDLPTLVLTGEFIDNVRRNSKNSITQL